MGAYSGAAFAACFFCFMGNHWKNMGYSPVVAEKNL
jgi:hypothetical protein